MARKLQVGGVVFAVATVYSAANAFVPLANHAKIGCFVSTIGRGRYLSGRRGYSMKNVDDNNNKDCYLTPEPVDPSSSASLDEVEFLFVDESVVLNDMVPPPLVFDSESLKSEEISVVNAQAIFTENVAILSSGGDESIDLGFDLKVDNNPNQVTDSTESVPVNEDLRAVLAASGEAAAAAEASMSAELVEVLDELAIEALNATTLNANNVDESNVLPPEVVPTIATFTPPIIPADLDQQVVGTSIMTIGQERPPPMDDLDIDLLESSKDNSDGKSVDILTPSVGKILKFAIPAIGVWLCGPILSLIDTSAVGVLSGTIQQAALNPAVAVTDYAALLIAFLYTGTTNMVASAQESDRGTSDMPLTAKMMVGAMRMSTYVGAGLGAILFVFARPLLRGIIGNDGISPAVFAAAMKYVRIRALGMPAAAILGSTQAACLGTRDIKSPLYVLGAAALVNLLGDIVFVGNSNPWIGGTAGAAWATVISQYAALAFFVRWLCNNGKKEEIEKPPEVVNLSNAILEMTSKSDNNDENGKNRRRSFRNVLESFKSNGRRAKTMRTRAKNENLPPNTRKLRRRFAFRRKSANRNATNATSTSKAADSGDSFSTRGFLKNRFSTIDLLKLPDEETRKKFAPFILPVTTTQVGRVSGYVAMAHVVASSLGTVSMAAQQVIVSIFYCLCPIADSLSLTAQSFVPAISEKEASIEKAAAMKKILVNFLKAGAVFGGAMMLAVCGIPLLTGFFTSDQAVINLVNSVVPLLLVFFSVHGVVCGTEGILLGQKDLGYLGKMYASFFAAVPYIMLGVKKKALAGSKSVGLTSVWTVFISYQLVRCGLWLMRSILLQRRTNIEGKQASVTKMNALAP